MEAQVIELRADDSRATPAIGRVNDGLTTLERNLLRLRDRARQAWDDFQAYTVRALRAANVAVKQFAEEHEALMRRLIGGTATIISHYGAIQTTVIGYRAARLALSPYTASVVIATRVIAGMTLAQGALIQAQAKAAAQAKLTAKEYLELVNVSKVSGQSVGSLTEATAAVRANSSEFEKLGIATDYGKLGKRSVLDTLQEANARVGQIRDPFEREATRTKLGLPDVRFSEELRRSAGTFGSQIGSDGAEALDRVRRGWDDFKLSIKDTGREIKSFFKSMFVEVAEGLAQTAVGLKDFVSKNAGSGVTPSQRRAINDATGTVSGLFSPIRRFRGSGDELRAFGATADRDSLIPGKPEFFDLPGVGVFNPIADNEAQRRNQLARDRENEAKAIAEAERKAEEARQGEKRSLEILSQVRAKGKGELAEVREQYRQYREELGKTTAAVQALNTAEGLAVQALNKAAIARVLKDGRALAADSQGVDDVRAGARLRGFERGQTFNNELLGLQQAGDLLAVAPNGQAEARRDSQLRQLDTQSLTARNLSQKLQIEQQRLGIEEQFIRESSRLKVEQLQRDFSFEIEALKVQYDAKLISEEQFQQKKSALTRIQELSNDRLGGKTQQEIDAAREQSIQRQTTLYVQQANTLRSAFESTIDALFSRTQSFWKSIGSIMQAAFLTPLKQWAASGLTTAFLGGRGGGSVPAGPGLFAGGLAASQLLGGGFGNFGGPFTGGFSGGPGAGGIIGRSSGALSGIGASGIGLLRQLGDIGQGGGPQFSAGIGGAKGGGLLLGGGLLAADGLRRGGFVGLAETTAGGALIGAKFGGPVGAVIGAAVGAAAGFVRLFVKGATEKAIQKVKSAYGVTINEELAKAVVQEGKQSGGLDIAITSPRVREMVELYAMATGQKIGPGNTVRPVSLVQSNGGIFQQSQSFGGTPYVFQSSLPTFGGGSAQVFNLQLSSQGTQSFLEGQTVQVVSNRATATSQAINAPLEYSRNVYAG